MELDAAKHLAILYLDECIERQLLDDVWLPPAGELCGSNIR